MPLLGQSTMAGITTKPALDCLPAELVEKIAECSRPRDSLALRATSSTMREKLWHHFLKQHVRLQECFVLDTGRLRKMSVVLSNDSVAKEVKSLTLATAPYHQLVPGDIPTVGREEEFGHAIAQEETETLFVLDQELHHDGPIDEKTLEDITKSLKKSPKCQLSLILTTHVVFSNLMKRFLISTHSPDAAHSRSHGDYAILPKYDTAYRDLLRVIVKEPRLRIAHIEIDDRQIVNVADLGHYALRESMRSLQTLRVSVQTAIRKHTIISPNDHRNVLRDPRYSDAQRFTLFAAEALQSLTVVGDPRISHFCCDESTRADVCNISGLLTTRALTVLTSLHLEHISIPECILIQVLGPCRATLRTLTFSDLVIDATSWRGVFIYLQRFCSALSQIKFEGLVTRQPGDNYVPTVFDVELRSEQLDHPPIDPYFDDGTRTFWKQHNKMEVQGTEAVRDELKRLSLGTEYLEFSFSSPEVSEQTLSQWSASGRGLADCFGIRFFENACACHAI